MKPDSMIVEPEFIMKAVEGICERGAARALKDLQGREPALAAFVQDRLATLAGRLALSGAPHKVVRGAHEEILVLVLGALEALQRSHYELWKETALEGRLARPEDQRQPRRRKPRPPTTEGDIPF